MSRHRASRRWSSSAISALYDRNGNLTQRNDPNQGVVTLRYNTDSTLASADLYNSPWYQASWTYAYDGNYRVTSQGFSGLGVQGATPVVGTASYTYDGGGRISWVTLPGQAAQNVPWDHDGNRLSYQGVTYSYNMDDSIATAGATSFTYFPQGALRTDAGHLYCYDGYDRLLCATVVSDVNCSSPNISYAYEGLDRQRAHSEGSGTTFMEYDGLSGTMSTEFFSGSPSGSGNTYALAGSRRTAVGTLAYGVLQSSTINYLADDGRGNIATAVTQGGSMACTARYDPWGLPLLPLSSSNPCNTGSTINTGFYTGSRRDSITGDYQFGVRTYDPSTGSFLQPDTYFGSQPGTKGSVVTDPLTRNRYVYVNGDPLNLIDPSGHDAMMLDPGGGIGYVDNNSPASANNYQPKPASCNWYDVACGAVWQAKGAWGVVTGLWDAGASDVASIGDLPNSISALASGLQDCARCVLRDTVAGIGHDVSNTIDDLQSSDPTRQGHASGEVTFNVLTLGLGGVGAAKGGLKIAAKASQVLKKARLAKTASNVPSLTIDDIQFGAKAAQHMPDFGMDVSDSGARAQFRDIITNISQNPSELRQGTWNPAGGGGNDYLFFLQGSDVVVTKADGTFVTILKGGDNNVWFQRATQR